MRPHRLHSLHNSYASELSAMRDALSHTHSHANNVGTSDHDHLLGGASRDVLMGRGGPDAIAGKAGNDMLLGGAENDTLWGGSENDTLKGGPGWDVLALRGHDCARASFDNPCEFAIYARLRYWHMVW